MERSNKQTTTTAAAALDLSETKNAQRIYQNKIEGTVLANRFKIGSFIGSGACGKVYKVYDSQNKSVPMAIKFSSQIDVITREIKAIVSISKRVYHGKDKSERRLIPEVFHFDKVVLSQKKRLRAVKGGHSKQTRCTGDRESNDIAESHDFDSLEDVHDEINIYYIMPRYGKDLETAITIDKTC